MKLAERLARVQRYLTRELWEQDHEPVSSAVRLLQFAIMLGEGFVRDRLLLRASALTYFTVLSLVPLVAVAVSIAGALGVGSETFVRWVVSTVAGGAPEARSTIRDLIQGVDLTGLGAIGGSVLFVTTVLAISNVERTFNDIWGVANGRSWLRRFTDYLAVLLVAPLLGGVALSLATTLRSNWAVEQMSEVPGFGLVDALGAALVPVAMLSVTFTFVYSFLPNTHVRWLSAAIGGVVAGVLVASAQALYVEFSVGAARADTFFGGFALLPLLFVWIYVFWAIVLFGAQIAFAHQNFAFYRQEVQGDPAGPAEREAIALRVMLEVARHFRVGQAAPEASVMAEELGVPVRTMRNVAERLVKAGLLAQRSDARAQDALQLARPADTIAMADVLVAMRGRRAPLAGDRRAAALVSEVLDEFERGVSEAVRGRTLADLLAALDARAVGAPDAADPDGPRAAGDAGG